MIEYKDIAWWYWLVTAILLTMGKYSETLAKISFSPREKVGMRV